MLIAVTRGIEHVAHVGRDARHAEHAAFAVEDGVHLVETDALATHDVGDNGRIDGAGTRTHHQALERREAHRRVDGLAVVHGRDGSAVAQMTGDEAEVPERASEQVRGLLGRVAVARAVRTIAANAIVLVIAHGKWVHVRLGRHRRVKCGVEDGDLWCVGHELAHHVDAGIGRWVVQRRQLLDARELFAHVIIDERRLAEVLASGYDAVADRIYLVEAADGTVGVLDEDVEQLGEALGNGKLGDVIGGLVEVRGKRDVHERLGRAYLLGKTPHERNLAVRFDELAFQAGASGIHDQYAHRHPPWIWMRQVYVSRRVPARRDNVSEQLSHYPRGPANGETNATGLIFVPFDEGYFSPPPLTPKSMPAGA